MDNAAYVAISRLSAQSRAMDVTAANIVTPALGPSFGVPPFGT